MTFSRSTTIVQLLEKNGDTFAVHVAGVRRERGSPAACAEMRTICHDVRSQDRQDLYRRNVDGGI